MKNAADLAYKKPVEYTYKRSLIEEYGDQLLNLYEWMTAHYHFGSCDSVLELGCGTGEFWQYAYKLLDPNNKLTLTDKSPEMLEQAKSQISHLPINCPVSFQQTDIDELSTLDIKVNAILSHLMIYHAKDVANVITNMNRMLSEYGWIGITTQYIDSFKSHMDVAHDIDSRIPDHILVYPEIDKLHQMLIEADDENDVYRYDYINHITWPTAEIAMQFTKTLLSISTFNPDENFYKQYQQRVQTIIADKGGFRTDFKVAFFICKRRIL
ncbi:MAG: class I SAM-dependent methyltransferase [Pseudomonadota bacterium]